MAILTTNKQIADAVKRSKANLRDEVTATGLQYSPRIDVFVLNLSDGTRCAVPREQLEGLRDAKPKQVSRFELVGGGSGIHWPDLDVDLSVKGLINGIYGSKKWMSDLGRLGGSVRSKKKAQAARLNGLKGGRPKAMAHGNRVSS